MLLVWWIQLWVLIRVYLSNIRATLFHLYSWPRWLKNAWAIVTPGPKKKKKIHWLDFLMHLGNGRKRKTNPTGIEHVGQNEILIFFCTVKKTKHNPPPPPQIIFINYTYAIQTQSGLRASKCLLIDLHGNNTSRHHSSCYSLVSSGTVINFFLTGFNLISPH